MAAAQAKFDPNFEINAIAKKKLDRQARKKALADKNDDKVRGNSF